ncbi:MAG TPA: hypothetical protein DEA08_03795 [Planctomycetes bacterium]|nr:hypothetical protein [Planctomycetota bacterium]
MKQGAVALIVGVVFVVGVGVGMSLSQKSDSGDGGQQVASGEGSSEKKPQREDVASDAPPSGPGAGPQAPSGGPSGPPAGPQAGPEQPKPDEPFRGPDAPAPPPPPPPSADALAEGEKIRRENDALRDKPRGGGRVTTLVYPKDPAEAEKLEAERNERWRRRLEYANNIRIQELQKSVGLTAAQAEALRKILDEELAARMDLVDKHRKKQISNTTFDEGVRETRDTAQAKLKALLSAEQYAKYGQLKPREQVLRDDVK